MIKYILKYEDLIERNIHKDFKIVETIDDDIIQHCIDSFNLKIKWDNMFDLVEANKRINLGDKLFVGYYEENIVGYCWMNKIQNDKYYLYNVFIKEDSTNRNYGATDLAYLMIKYHTNGLITLDIDEWNTKSQKVAEKMGFKPI
jgi:RimJ/RimL family protein N-acetyltransferase